MPVYVLPIQKLTDEERRNLLLRVRLGQQTPPSKRCELEQDILRVDGKAMVHSPRVLHPYENIQVVATGQKIRLADKRKLVTKKVSKNSVLLQRCKGDATIEDADGKSPKEENACQEFREGEKLIGDKKHEKALCNESDTVKTHFESNDGVDMSTCDRGENLKTDTQKKNAESVPNTEHTKLKTHSSGSSRSKKVCQTTEIGGVTAQRRSLGDVRASSEKKSSNKVLRRKGAIPRLSSTPNLSYVAEDSRTTSAKSSKSHLSRRRSSKNVDGSKRNQNKETVKDAKEKRVGSGKEEQEETTVRKFFEMPDSKPNNVCFDFPGLDLTYLDVKQAIERVIPRAFETNKVLSLQFENINVKLGTKHKNNRWHIELSDIPFRNMLIKSGLIFRMLIPVPPSDNNPSTNEENSNDGAMEMIKLKVDVKLYDAVMMDEYKLFLKSSASEEQLQSAILLCTGRGNALLSTLL